MWLIKTEKIKKIEIDVEILEIMELGDTDVINAIINMLKD